MRVSIKLSIGFICLSCLGVFIRVYVLLSLPKSKSESVSVSKLSGERAYDFLRNHIAVEPHYWDTEENEKVFDFLVSQGKRLEEQYGTDVIEVDTHITNIPREETEDNDAPNFAVIGNVAFWIKGEHTGEASSAIQISSHYDSVRGAPGATDAGAGCAVMLELAHVLASREEKLPHDVLILFVDAEEVGLNGSHNWQFGDSLEDVEKHPWSELPSLVINLEGSGIANGKEMLIRANSPFASRMYNKHARSPRALSLTEFLFRAIAVGYTDTDLYMEAGLHCMDLIYVKDRWAYHSAEDTVENVKPAALQHLGNNLVSLVEGIAHDKHFPMPRLPVIITDSHWEYGNQDSGSVYYSILDNSAVYQTRGQARAMYLSISILAAIGMCFLYPTNPEIPNDTNFKSIAKHTGIAFLNFFLGMLVSFGVYAGAGYWKKAECDDIAWWCSPWDGIWANKEAIRSVLTFLSVAFSTFFVYASFRGGWKSVLCCCRITTPRGKDEKDPDSEELQLMIEPDTIENLREESSETHDDAEGNAATTSPTEIMLGSLSLEGTVNVEAPGDIVISSESTPVSQDDSPFMIDRVQLARIAHVGIFFFFDILLFIFALALPDVAPFVFFQTVFFWIGSFAEAVMTRLVGSSKEEEPSHQKTLRKWALRSFVSVVPSLFVIPDGFMLLTLYFGFFLDELGIWYGATLLEAFNFVLVLLVVVPTALLLPTKFARMLGFALLAAWLIIIVVTMAI